MSYTYWHDHGAAVNILLSRKKKWYLLPPGSYFGPRVDSMSNYLKHIYKHSPIKPLEVIQYPGDCIFIPATWNHAVINLEEVIGVTFQLGEDMELRKTSRNEMIKSERYLNTDVVSRFDTIHLEELEQDRVLISGTRGEPAPRELKVAMNYQGGFRNQVSIGLTGLDIEAKAELIERQFWHSCPYSPEDYETVVRKFLPTQKENPATNEEAVAVYKIIVKDPDERKVGRAFSNAGTEIGLCSIPGMFGTAGGPGPGQPFGIYWPALIDSQLVPMEVVVDGKMTVVDNTAGAPALQIEHPAIALPAVPQGPTRSAPLGHLFGARSGDKGPNANLGIFARDLKSFSWLSQFLTIEKLKELMPEAAERDGDRYDLPNLLSLNFIFYGLLEEGVAASTRQDPQAKALGEYLRAKVVQIPEELFA